ncbi:MAG: hypothetical protein E7634_07290 [Ruminococcaceae bacterium]|nr:hypothetical protein [Oscillospiraceae bacterium]
MRVQEEMQGEIILKLNDHENRISETARRLEQQEQQIKAIGELSLNVRELAVTMKSMIREQISHSERITRLERAPLSRYEKLICSVLSAVAGAAVGFLLNLL